MRDPGREGARLPVPSLKLEGGNLLTGIRGRVRRVDSGVCTRMAEFLKIFIVGLSERLKLESEEEGRDGVCK